MFGKTTRVAVYDTYITKKDGSEMHFDVIVKDGTTETQAQEYGREYLKQAGQEGQTLTAKECSFCHVQNPTDEMKKDIEEKGYFIAKMGGCP